MQSDIQVIISPASVKLQQMIRLTRWQTAD